MTPAVVDGILRSRGATPANLYGRRRWDLQLPPGQGHLEVAVRVDGSRTRVTMTRWAADPAPGEAAGWLREHVDEHAAHTALYTTAYLLTTAVVDVLPRWLDQERRWQADAHQAAQAQAAKRTGK